MNNINKQSEDRLMDTENRLIVIRRGWDGGRVSMVKELSKEKKERLITVNSTVIARGKERGGRRE